MSEQPILACKRCKVKKLKCDIQPKTCGNCVKTGSRCTQVDSRSGREYPRGYVEELLDRIQALKQGVHHPPENASPGTTTTASLEPSSSVARSPGTQTTYHEVGSVTSMARLVEAAVIPTATNLAPFEVGSAASPTPHDRRSVQAVPASLPARDTSRLLFDSYLNGLHLLHPFLQRSRILGELEDAYKDPQGQSSPSLFRIYMVLAIGAVSLVRNGHHDIPPADYYAAAMRHAGNCAFELSGLEQIQALMLVLIFSLQQDIGIGNRWDLSRLAMRTCIENDFHRSSSSLQPMAEQMRRRVFWACYIADRTSGSSLGRPMALQDDDIDIELPIDADDDLIETGNAEAQFVRGMSEVSAQLRQVQLRKITSKIATQLYRKSDNRSGVDSQVIAAGILSDLDHWHTDFPVMREPRNAYETIHWRDLLYYRERLKCYRLLVLTTGESDKISESGTFSENLTQCLGAAARMAESYGALRTADKLILNWTCVHDMMSAGFTALYCGIARCQHMQNGHAAVAHEVPADMASTVVAVLDTLGYVAEKWPTINQHLHAFKNLSGRVSDSLMQSTTGTDAGTSTPWTWPAWTQGQPLANTGPTVVGYESGFSGNADMWDAAMAAFLDEPLDLDNIDWGAIAWDTMLPPSDSHMGHLRPA